MNKANHRVSRQCYFQSGTWDWWRLYLTSRTSRLLLQTGVQVVCCPFIYLRYLWKWSATLALYYNEHSKYRTPSWVDHNYTIRRFQRWLKIAIKAESFSYEYMRLISLNDRITEVVRSIHLLTLVKSSDVYQTDTPQLPGIGIVPVVFGSVFRYGIGMYQTIQTSKNFSKTSFSTCGRRPRSLPRRTF